MTTDNLNHDKNKYKIDKENVKLYFLRQNPLNIWAKSAKINY